MAIRVLDIIGGTSVDGPGLRTSIYFAGCTHNCPGCHNPESHDTEGGRPMTVGEIMEIIADNDFNVSFSGGDPMYQAEALLPLVRLIHEAGYTLWCYTGYTYEEVAASPVMNALLDYVDVLVDGRYIDALRDTGLRFRGSSNQRIIDVRASRAAGEVILAPYYNN